MVNIRNEIDSLADLIVNAAPSVIEKQMTPKKPEKNSVVVKWAGDRGESMSGLIYELKRLYQVIYYSDDELQCIDTADKIRKAINDTIKLQISESEDFMTLDLIAFSAPQKTGHDLYAIVGILPVSVFVKRTQPTYEKMMHIGVNITNGGESE